MDCQIMDVIRAEAARLPELCQGQSPYRLYTEGKALLSALFPGAYEAVCRVLAEKYGI